jgi:tetratricopeptide (TPR) repeat protein
VANYRPAPGDFTCWRHDHPGFDPFKLPLVQAKSHVLAHAIGDLAADASEVLQTVAAFRAPVDYATVTALFVPRRKWTVRQLDVVLTDLEDRGLLGWDRTANTYDLHPIVRGVVWTGLDDVRQRAVYGALEEHFSAIPKPSDDLSVADVNKVIGLFAALVGLGRHADAAELYFDRLHLPGLDFVEHGMGHVKIALMESLFPAGLKAQPQVSEDNVAAVLAQLSYAYEKAGRIREAYVMGIRWANEKRAALPLAFASNATRAFQLGNVREAVRLSHSAVESGVSSNYTLAKLAVLEAQVGDAAHGLRIVRDMPSGDRFEPRAYEAFIRLLRGEFDTVIALEAVVRDHAKNRVVIAMAGAEARIRLGRPSEVIDFLMNRLRMVRAWAVVEKELDCLLLLAEAHRRLGGQEIALAYLEDLAEPAARGEFRLIQAKAAVVLAEVERDQGNRSAAIAAATEAYRLAWCDGPPYTYYWTLKRAEELLRELGGAIPQVLNPVRGADGTAG